MRFILNRSTQVEPDYSEVCECGCLPWMQELECIGCYCHDGDEMHERGKSSEEIYQALWG